MNFESTEELSCVQRAELKEFNYRRQRAYCEKREVGGKGVKKGAIQFGQFVL